MDAIILAGGLGTRLRDVVPDLPKPLAPVAGRPFLEWVLAHLTLGGAVDRIFLSVGYRAEAISAAIGDRFSGIPVIYVEEVSPLGTGGALKQALRFVADGDVLVLNGDTFADFDARSLMIHHGRAERPLTVSLAVVADVGRYGQVKVVGNQVTGFAEKGGTGPGLINAGVYALHSSLLDKTTLAAPFSFESDFMMPQVATLKPAYMQLTGRFIDIGVADDYARAQTLLGSEQ